MFSATDNFNRADANPVGGNWVTCTGSNNARIVSNQLKSSSTGSYVYYNATTANDQYSQCVQAASVCGPAVRLQGTSRDGYFYHVNSATLYSRVSGTANSILTTGDTPSTTAVYKLEVIGSTLTVYKDGISIGSVTNTDFTSGWTGIYIGSNTGKVDDWAGGDSGQAMTADNSTQTNSTTSGAIGQEHAVTAGNSTQANISSSGAIVQTMLGEMLADNSTQVNTSTSGEVAQSQNVTGSYVTQVTGSTSGAIVMTHALVTIDSIQVNASNNGAISQIQVLSAGNSMQVNQSSSGRMLLTPGFWYEEAAEIINWNVVPTDSSTWTPTPPSTSIWN